MQLPFAQKSAARGFTRFYLWVVEARLRRKALLRYAPKVILAFPEPEARESVARTKCRALTVTTLDNWNPAYSSRAAGRRQRCSRHEPSSLRFPEWRHVRGRANGLELSRPRAFTCKPR